MKTPPVRRLLVPHPVSDPGPVREISVVSARDGDRMLLVYRLDAALDSLSLPAPRPAARADELWRHTCFEAFVRPEGSTGYVEYNFSPSGQWAAYQFSAYRADMRACDRGAAPIPVVQISTDHLLLTVSIDLAWLAPSRGVNLHVGVTAVIEDRAGVLSYWALVHSAEKPDFHLSDSFVLEL